MKLIVQNKERLRNTIQAQMERETSLKEELQVYMILVYTLLAILMIKQVKVKHLLDLEQSLKTILKEKEEQDNCLRENELQLTAANEKVQDLKKDLRSKPQVTSYHCE